MKATRAVFLLVLSLCTPFWQTASAGEATTDNNTGYLALGDSVAFGYKPAVPTNLENYKGGYVGIVADALRHKVANASCFGETSKSFLSENAPDLGCNEWRRLGLPMWVSYTGTQMDYAISHLRQNQSAKLVTINIGGNDLGLLLQSCGGATSCQLAGLPRVLAAYSGNLLQIFSRIRYGAGYRGRIVLLTYYAFNYNDRLQVSGLAALNAVASGIATAFGARIADGFRAFQAASAAYGGDACAAGLLARLPNGTCDTHPSALGHQLLAKEVIAVSDHK